eukprot:m.84606 g.84606  ORF g.84606 m.84606 type:complete len:322 (-) comp8354_c0_seq1:32-997(-)
MANFWSVFSLSHGSVCNFRRNHIGDDGAAHLAAAVAANSPLQKLYLSHNGITDRGALAMAESVPGSRITVLSILEGNKASPSVREKLARNLGGSALDDLAITLESLTLCYGKANQMDARELRRELGMRGLDDKGQRSVTLKRLKGHFRRVAAEGDPAQATAATEAAAETDKRLSNLIVPYDYICVLDFEATCERDMREFPHEIIEFPIVVIDVATNTQIEEIRHYVRPVFNPVLSGFCTELTGITQETVDAAEPFPVVLERVEEWLRTRFNGKRVIFATDGPWDFRDFFTMQCMLSQIRRPAFRCVLYLVSGNLRTTTCCG